MNIVVIVGIAVGLAMDAVAVSIASGMMISRVTGRHVFRLAFHFGLFQALMPVAGWYLGTVFAAFLIGWNTWVACGLLTIIGGKMLVEGIRNDRDALPPDPSRGLLMVSLALATSIDALAVGVSLAMLQQDIWIPAVLIGVITGGLSALGVVFGSRIGARWRQSATVAGGCVLILIGIKIVVGA